MFIKQSSIIENSNKNFGPLFVPSIPNIHDYLTIGAIAEQEVLMANTKL